MKRTIGAFLGMGLVIGLGYVYLGGNTDEITYNRVEEIATSTEPAYPADWLEEAEKAKADVLHRKELEKENADLTNQIKELEARQAEIEKELGF